MEALKKWWCDDSGSGFSQMSTHMLEIIIGVAAVTLILSGLFFSAHKLGVDVGNQIKNVSP